MGSIDPARLQFRMPPAWPAKWHSHSPDCAKPGQQQTTGYECGKSKSSLSPAPLNVWRATCEDAATQQLTIRELLASARANILSSPATNSYARLVLQKAARTAGKRGRERQWTLGQALRCSLHFLLSSY